ncbi:MAG: peptidoglycan-binding domain-containing protein [Bacillota bacterium]
MGIFNQGSLTQPTETGQWENPKDSSFKIPQNKEEPFNGPENWIPPLENEDSDSNTVTGVSETTNDGVKQGVKDSFDNPPKFDSTIEESKANPTTSLPKTTQERVVLKMTSENIILVQKALNKAGFYNGEYDGILDEEFLEKIKEFQRYVEIEPDGIVDNQMIKFLDIYSGGCESAYALKINITKK